MSFLNLSMASFTDMRLIALLKGFFLTQLLSR
jgi:hypothetical protein